MIKFYQGTYSELSTQNRLESANNICFVTDRQVLIMGGKEYGKDGGAIKIDSGMGASVSGTTETRDVVSGTLFYFKGDQSILRYMGTGAAATNWEVVQEPRLSGSQLLSSTFIDPTYGTVVFSESGVSDAYSASPNDIKVAIDALENKVKGAYTTTSTDSTKLAPASVTSGTNNIVVSDTNGITRTQYGLDNGNVSAQILDTSMAATAKSADLDKTLVNARTLAQVYEDVKSQATTIATPSVDDANGDTTGLITFTSTSGLTGTTWTAHAHILTGAQSGSLKVNNGRLENHIAIRKLASTDNGYNEGYRAQYALFNENGNTKVQIGDTINLVKDQFLKNVEYVIAWQDSTTSVWYEYDGSAWHAIKADGTIDSAATVPSNVPAPDAANRYMKFIFALTNKTDDGGAVAGENDSVVYINVNELFDSYKGASGVAIDQNTNTISGVVDAATQKAIADTASKGTHYGANAYLTVGTNGFAVNGINQEITAYIEDLDNSIAAPANQWMTSVGVDNGKLTAAYRSAYTSGINFNGVAGTSVLLTSGSALNMPSTTYVTVNDAISALALHIGSLDGSFDGSPVGSTPTQFVYAWEQTDGLLATSAKIVDASDLRATSKSSDNLTATVLTSNGIVVTASPTQKVIPVYAIDSDKSNLTPGTLQKAIGDIVTSVANTFASLDMSQVGSGVVHAPSAVSYSENYAPYRIVNTVVQSDGYVSATDIELVAQTVGFEPLTSNAYDPATLNKGTGLRATGAGAYIPVSGYTVGAALSSISNYIGSLDFDDAGAGEAPSAGTARQYIIVNTIKQDQGQISETKIGLTAGNTYNATITEVLPDGNYGTSNATANSTKSTSQVRVGIGQGSVQDALNSISNILADYLSFHNAGGSVI